MWSVPKTKVATETTAEVFKYLADHYDETGIDAEREDFLKYGEASLRCNLFTMDEFRDEVWDSIKIRCGEPYCWYIDIGAYIADELRGDITGVRRCGGKWEIMSKWDFREYSSGNYAENGVSMDDVYVFEDVCLNEAIQMGVDAESETSSECPSPIEEMERPDDMGEWIGWCLTHNTNLDSLSEYPPDCPSVFHERLQYEVDMWLERQVDIARGK